MTEATVSKKSSERFKKVEISFIAFHPRMKTSFLAKRQPKEFRIGWLLQATGNTALL